MTFSVVKRKFGEVLRARKFYNQVKELKIKLLVYNINKKAIEMICIKLRVSTEPNFLHCTYLQKSMIGLTHLISLKLRKSNMIKLLCLFISVLFLLSQCNKTSSESHE